MLHQASAVVRLFDRSHRRSMEQVGLLRDDPALAVGAGPLEDDRQGPCEVREHGCVALCVATDLIERSMEQGCERGFPPADDAQHTLLVLPVGRWELPIGEPA